MFRKILKSPPPSPSPKETNKLLLRGVLFRLVGVGGLGLMLLQACSSQPKRNSLQKTFLSPHKVIQAEGRIWFQPEKKSPYHIGFHLMAFGKERQLKWQLSSLSGFPLSVIHLSGDQLSYLLLKEKRFYKGKSYPKALAPLGMADIDPQQLFAFFFRDDRYLDENWKCRRTPPQGTALPIQAKAQPSHPKENPGQSTGNTGNTGRLKSCRHLSKGSRIEWIISRKKKAPMILLKYSQFKAKIWFYSQKTVSKPPLWNLDIPEGFTSLSSPEKI